MKKIGKIMLSAFTVMSTSVFAEDLSESKIKACMEKENANLIKMFSSSCGVAEDKLKGDGSKLSEKEKKCLLDNFEKNQKEYMSEIDKIVKKCS